jgi:predicted transposase YdaD
MKNERDRYAALKYAREEGFGRGEAKGRSEGREEGRNEGRYEGREELFALLESGVSLTEAKQKFGLL